MICISGIFSSIDDTHIHLDFSGIQEGHSNGNALERFEETDVSESAVQKKPPCQDKPRKKKLLSEKYDNLILVKQIRYTFGFVYRGIRRIVSTMVKEKEHLKGKRQKRKQVSKTLQRLVVEARKNMTQEQKDKLDEKNKQLLKINTIYAKLFRLPKNAIICMLKGIKDIMEAHEVGTFYNVGDMKSINLKIKNLERYVQLIGKTPCKKTEKNKIIFLPPKISHPLSVLEKAIKRYFVKRVEEKNKSKDNYERLKKPFLINNLRRKIGTMVRGGNTCMIKKIVGILGVKEEEMMDDDDLKKMIQNLEKYLL